MSCNLVFLLLFPILHYVQIIILDILIKQIDIFKADSINNLYHLRYIDFKDFHFRSHFFNLIRHTSFTLIIQNIAQRCRHKFDFFLHYSNNDWF